MDVLIVLAGLAILLGLILLAGCLIGAIFATIENFVRWTEE